MNTGASQPFHQDQNGDIRVIGESNDSNRDQWIRRELAIIPKGTRLMDAGAGECRFENACSHLDYVSQDLGDYDGKGDGAGLHTGKWDTSKISLQCDLLNVPEPNASFGAILCTEVLEHIPDPIGAIKEMARLLKPGGTLLLTAPFNSISHFTPQYYYTGFSRYFYETHLPSFGLEVELVHTSGDFYEALAQEIHRLPQIARDFDSKELNFFERKAIQILFKGLARIQNKKKHSKEVLSHGIFIRGRKFIS